MTFFWYENSTRVARHNREKSPPRTSSDPYQGKATSERRIAIVAKDIMCSPVRTLPMTASFDDARLFFRQSRYRHVPILNQKGLLVGIISDRDMLREAAQTNQNVQGWLQEVVNETKTVADFRTSRVLVGTPRTEIRQIARALFEERIGSLPILDEKNLLVGIITRSDILRTLITHTPLELWI